MRQVLPGAIVLVIIYVALDIWAPAWSGGFALIVAALVFLWVLHTLWRWSRHRKNRDDDGGFLEFIATSSGPGAGSQIHGTTTATTTIQRLITMTGIESKSLDPGSIMPTHRSCS
jgi:hypothetical protein